MPKELAAYKAEDGSDITLTFQNVRDVISTSPNVTDKEVMLFAALCKSQRLNPFTREVHLIKYGNTPASMVVGKGVYQKRAQRNPRFKGLQAGLFVVDANGKGKEREGSMALDGERIVGAWCKVYVDGYDVPMYDSVGFNEYAGRKKDGSLNGQWAKMPGTMIRKVAIVHALRDAFPDEFEGLYDAAEMGVELQDAPQPEPRFEPRYEERAYDGPEQSYEYEEEAI